MELRTELLKHIKEKGLKKSYVADKIGITPSKLSNYLHGKLILVDDTESKIEKYLEQHN